MNRNPPSLSFSAPARRIAGFALLGAGIGFTGLMSLVHIMVELFD